MLYIFSSIPLTRKGCYEKINFENPKEFKSQEAYHAKNFQRGKSLGIGSIGKNLEP